MGKSYAVYWQVLLAFTNALSWNIQRALRVVGLKRKSLTASWTAKCSYEYLQKLRERVNDIDFV